VRGQGEARGNKARETMQQTQKSYKTYKEEKTGRKKAGCSPFCGTGSVEEGKGDDYGRSITNGDRKRWESIHLL